MKNSFPMSIDQICDVTQDVLVVWYRSHKRVLNTIAATLERDLAGFKNQSGSNRLVFYSVRVKDEESYIDKITGLREKNRVELQAKYAEYGNNVTPGILVTDLIGARLVFYFSDDLDLAFNYFGSYPAFRVEEAEAYEAVIEGSPLYSESHVRISDLIKTLPNPKFSKKRSAYESYHLQVRYNAKYAYARTRAINKSNSHIQNDLRAFKHLEDFPMEIQIRTILQHTWAQTEHRLNYNLVKRSDELALDSPLFNEEFLCHKSILWAAEHHQRVVLQHFQYLHPLSGAVTDPPAAIGDRARNFDSREKKRIAKINEILHNRRPNYVLSELKDLVRDLSEKYRSDKYYVLDFIEDAQKWGRQRLILLLFGYLLLTGNEDTKREIVKLFAESRQFSFGNLQMAPIILYEHVRFLDTNFRYKTKNAADRAFFSDPLVFYRAAGAYFAAGNYRRCIYLLNEVVTKKYFDGFKSSARTSYFLNEKHFMRKLGEYYWRAYITDKRKEHADLRHASEQFACAIRSKQGPNLRKDFLLEDQKAAALAATVFAFRYLEQDPQNIEEFRRNVIPLGRVIDRVRAGNINNKVRSLLLQGRAVIEYANNNYEQANKFSRHALESVLKHQSRDRFVKYVCQEILRLIHYYREPGVPIDAHVRNPVA